VGTEPHLVFSACRHGAGTRADWPYFARWHYRSHTLGPVRQVTLLWHEDRPIGICVFAAPARSLRLRNQFFGLRGTGDRLFLKRLNTQLWVLARVVIHPTYRGAGLATDFVRASCRACPVPWIETLTAMGHLHPFFEKAGFHRVGTVRKDTSLSPRGHAQLYGGSKLTAETLRKSHHAEPVYYLRDNRI
jgi:GNAT superfamily N-acetyltransferase